MWSGTSSRERGRAGVIGRQNPIFDNRNGQITVGEFRELFRNRYGNVD